MQYLKDIKDGQNVNGIYFVKQKNLATTKNGKEYFNVLLQDKTKVMDAKVWDVTGMGIEDFEAMDYVEITGQATTFNGAMQISISRARKVEESEVDIKEYMPCSSRDVDEMMEELITFINSVLDPNYKAILEELFVKNETFVKAFKNHSAAKAMHHAFVGGLLEHTLNVTKLCDSYCKQYSDINRDLLITAAICHDIGKINELSAFPENDYTDQGQLLGHIVMGYQMVAATAGRLGNVPAVKLRELEHCILAHHGELEYGSPKKPALMEAIALNFADNTDAKLQIMREGLAEDSNVKENGWYPYNRGLESPIRKTSENN